MFRTPFTVYGHAIIFKASFGHIGPNFDSPHLPQGLIYSRISVNPKGFHYCIEISRERNETCQFGYYPKRAFGGNDIKNKEQSSLGR